jgi:L-fucose isomerase-like protein
MNRTGLYTLTSGLHSEVMPDASEERFIREIAAAGADFDFCGEDFSRYGSHDAELIYVRTGGTENAFKAVFPRLAGPVRLLTSGASNSLAASMEILSFLRQQGREGEILHGSAAYIAERIAALSRAARARRRLQGSRAGVIGRPSDWLIASDPDREAVRDRLGIELVDIPMEELVTEIRLGLCEAPSGVPLKGVRHSVNPKVTQKTFDGALDIYGAVKRLIDRYDLSAVTVRCFDLLSAVGNTGCLALALLNSEGVPAGCEGDIPTMLTMCVANALFDVPGFMANPSRMDPSTGEMVFAHCTVPFSMLRDYSYDTHFESGIGVAVKGELPEGPVTLFKMAPGLDRCFAAEAGLIKNLSEKHLCRTQVLLRLDDRTLCRDYFLKDPIGNHHVIVPGRHAQEIRDFLL